MLLDCNRALVNTCDRRNIQGQLESAVNAGLPCSRPLLEAGAVTF